MNKKIILILSITLVILLFSLSNVSASNNITINIDKKNITYGEPTNVTLTLKENGTPLSGKEVSLKIYRDIYDKTAITNEKGQAIFSFNGTSLNRRGYSVNMYYQDRLYNFTDLEVLPGKAKATINLETLKDYKTKLTIQVTDNKGNPIEGYSLDSYLNPTHKGKSLVVYKDGSWIENGIDLISGNDLKTDNNGIITKIIDGIIYKGEVSFFLYGSDYNYNINNTVVINNKLPSIIKITYTYLTCAFYGIHYSLSTYDGKKINKQIKAVVDSKTYYGENNVLLIPVNKFKKYSLKLLFDGDSNYAKSEYNHSYTLNGNEVIGNAVTYKSIKKFKRFGHTYSKSKCYKLTTYLNGKVKKSFLQYITTLVSPEKYRLFKTANEKIKINGFIPLLYLKNKLRIKAYYDGNNDIKLNYYFQYKKGGISKLAGYIKIHKYKTYYSWYNKQFLLSFSSNLNKKLAIKYARIIGW